MKELKAFFSHSSQTELPLSEALGPAERFSTSLSFVEQTALQHNIFPTRYIRNCLSSTEQLQLLQAHVTIIGCGGLGGAVSMMLARTGVGSLHLVDPDVFEEHNLNRQNFCTISTIGEPKVDVTAKALLAISPGLSCTTNNAPFSADDIKAGPVIDCLDAVKTRKELATLCARHNQPLIHGAVSKWYGRVGVVTTENKLIDLLYGNENEHLPDKPLRVLSPTVYQIASLQVAAVIKQILGYQPQEAHGWIDCDLKNMVFETISYTE